MVGRVQCMVSYSILFTLFLAQFWEAFKKHICSYSTTFQKLHWSLFFLICTIEYTSTVYRLKKKRKKTQFALSMLMYGVIFSDFFNAICKCINKGYKTKPVCTTHNTQGWDIERFESIIDICTSRNYLEMREYSTAM